jgi:hypothetical protein
MCVNDMLKHLIFWNGGSIFDERLTVWITIFPAASLWCIISKGFV